MDFCFFATFLWGFWVSFSSTSKDFPSEDGNFLCKFTESRSTQNLHCCIVQRTSVSDWRWLGHANLWPKQSDSSQMCFRELGEREKKSFVLKVGLFPTLAGQVIAWHNFYVCNKKAWPFYDPDKRKVVMSFQKKNLRKSWCWSLWKHVVCSEEKNTEYYLNTCEKTDKNVYATILNW